MNFKCILSFHKWDGCKCSACGKTRDEGHDWSKDCETCAKCHKTKTAAHVWSGCKCSTCGKTRDEGHKWDGCKCSTCGKTRDEGHKWDGCKCSTCGKTRNEGHEWSSVSDRCAKCGKSRREPIYLVDELIGYIETRDDGIIIAKDVKLMIVAEYDPRTNITKDAGGLTFVGNALKQLITANTPAFRGWARNNLR